MRSQSVDRRIRRCDLVVSQTRAPESFPFRIGFRSVIREFFQRVSGTVVRGVPRLFRGDNCIRDPLCTTSFRRGNEGQDQKTHEYPHLCSPDANVVCKRSGCKSESYSARVTCLSQPSQSTKCPPQCPKQKRGASPDRWAPNSTHEMRYRGHFGIQRLSASQPTG
jgi:hypothetical protein